MPQLTMKKKSSIKMNVSQILSETGHYIAANPMFVLCVCVVNMVYMLVLKAIPDGVQNPLFVIWIITYYLFWCFFYRYYYGLKPYFLSSAMLGSLTPSTKALFLLALLMCSVAFLPMLPLFWGDTETYNIIYNRYLLPISRDGVIHFSGPVLICVYTLMVLIAPPLICKPYLAWISSLRKQNASFRKVGDKTKGNYLQFVIISALLLFPEALASEIDAYFNLHNWLDYTVSTLVFIYTNIIFAKIYDFFYLKH
ncbi:MAG: hypothetical protein IJ218_02260 [Alphaproteobacteria bacterium]|nr:hypothetical protein [Alphaproteobacteria bacterium]